MFNVSDNGKIGIFLVLLGISCFFFGVLMLFDRSLLMIGNLCFIIGLILLIGLIGTIKFFTKKSKRKPSGIFLSGFILILFKLSLIGGIL